MKRTTKRIITILQLFNEMWLFNERSEGMLG